MPAHAICIAVTFFLTLSTTVSFSGHNLSTLTGLKRGIRPSNDVRVETHLFVQHGDRMDGRPMIGIADLDRNDKVETKHKEGTVFLDRQQFMKQLLVVSTSAVAVSGSATEVNAQEEEVSTASVFVRKGKGFGYSFVPPPGFAEGNKPLKTHLDEVNFTKEGVRGYQYGITIDPVRLKSLSEFGTPEQVAAKVVTAEVNRDGIFEVTLYRDPVEDPNTGAYEIDYVSDGKRGKKHLMTRTAVQDGMLYVLTAQVKDEEFKDREQEMKLAVKTFAPGQ